MLGAIRIYKENHSKDPSFGQKNQNMVLMHAVPLDEVEVVKGLARNKVPRPSDFTTELFQETRPFMVQYILEVVEESHRSKKVHLALNSSFIALIPRYAQSKEPQGFRIINFCNVIYKIIFIFMVKRLKPIFPFLISPKQTSFVEGCQILYGIITTQEFVHSLKHLKAKGMLIKIDLSKAYDHLS